MPLSKRQLEILQHSLGANSLGRGSYQRNHFCAGPEDAFDCHQLVGLGYMEPHRSSIQAPYPTFSVTISGKAALWAEGLAPPRLLRALLYTVSPKQEGRLGCERSR